MVTTQALASTSSKDPQFNSVFLSKVSFLVTISELESLHFEASTLPKVIVLSRLDKNILLGNVNTLTVKIKN